MAFIVAEPGGTNCRCASSQRWKRANTRRDLRRRIRRRSPLGRASISRSILNRHWW